MSEEQAKGGRELATSDQRGLVRRSVSLVTRGLRDLERIEEALKARRQRGSGDLFRAIALRDVERAREILGGDPGQASFADSSGWTALHEAAAVGERKLVELLLSRGAKA